MAKEVKENEAGEKAEAKNLKRYVASGGYAGKEMTFRALEVVELDISTITNPKIIAKLIEINPENIEKYKIPAHLR